jgi:SAM-dependent methyltransferase
MAATVSVLLPSTGAAREAIETYLQSTGFSFDVRVVTPERGESEEESIRRAGLDAPGDIIVIADPELPYPVSAIGDAVAPIQTGTSQVVFGCRRPEDDPSLALLRWLLVPTIPDPTIRLKALSRDAARLLFNESKLNGGGFELELAFLANKYGFRVERLALGVKGRRRAFGGVSGIVPIVHIRLTDRKNGYRAARRCPVCFSSEVSTWAQLPGNVVRACHRCKCRYLAQFTDLDDTAPVRRVVRPHPPIADPEPRSDTAREKISRRRIGIVRRNLQSRARLLEIGVRDGGFGLAAARDYEYVGIDTAPGAARAARAKGLEVYCSNLAGFVNTGPPFDAITLYHVFENMPDPHDALARLTELIKPGGTLFLTTYDTEGLVFLLYGRKRVLQNFRTHLILYSRSALIELLEHSGFEITAIGPDFEYRDHRIVKHWMASHWPRLAPLGIAMLKFFPDPLLVSSGSIRIVAKRRAGPPLNLHAIRSVEPTHAR